jgi:hypothetical protein
MEFPGDRANSCKTFEKYYSLTPGKIRIWRENRKRRKKVLRRKSPET